MSIRPTGITVLVRRDPPEEVTKGGIVIPGVAQQWAESGTVLAAGPGRKSMKTGKHLPLDVKAGDRVMFPYSAGEEIEHEGETLLLIWESLIEAVAEK